MAWPESGKRERGRSERPRADDARGRSAPESLRAGEVRVGDERFVVLWHPAQGDLSLEELTEAESVVLRLVLRGLSNEQIAYVRATSVRTVANQVASIFRKAGVGSRVELAARLRIARSGSR